LRKKIQRQDAYSTSAPPTSGPITVAIPLQAVQAPIAHPERSRYVARRSARLPGVRSAPKTPWISRAAISTPSVGAMPARTEEAAKPTTPHTNVRT
jgi:hypothetical protein